MKEIVIFIGIGMVLSAMLLLLFMRSTNTVQRTLLSMLIFMGVGLISGAFFYFRAAVALSTVLSFHYLMLGGAAMAYGFAVHRLIEQDKMDKRALYWYYVPFLVISLLPLLVCLFMTDAQELDLLKVIFDGVQPSQELGALYTWYVYYGGWIVRLLMFGMWLELVIWSFIAVHHHHQALHSHKVDLKYHNEEWNHLLPFVSVLMLIHLVLSQFWMFFKDSNLLQLLLVLVSAGIWVLTMLILFHVQYTGEDLKRLNIGNSSK